MTEEAILPHPDMSAHTRRIPVESPRLAYRFSRLPLPSAHPSLRHNAHNTSYPCPPPPR